MSNSKVLFCSVFLCFTFIISFASSSYLNTTLTTTHQCSSLLLFKQNLSSFTFVAVVDRSYYYYYYYDSRYYSPCKNWLGSDGYYPLMMNWNTSTTDCCDWDGVTCDHSTGDVIGLDLSCGMLQGTLHPNTSLFNLPHLQRLNLAYNDFGGSQIPSEIGRFSNSLTHLNISNSMFSGKVPTGVTLLHKMVSFDLSLNDFSLEPRVFLNMLRNYTTLEELLLPNVDISFVLPGHLNISSSSVKLLNLQWTGLKGNLPRNIFRLRSMEMVDLSMNSLTGEIPWEISLLPKLVSLDLSYTYNLRMKPHIFNTLLQNSTLLSYLRLRSVNIGSDLPTYLNIMSSLKTLNLRYTGLKGKLPDNIFHLPYLEELDLSGNTNLTGPLPRVNATTPLKLLNLGSTNLSGKIPDSVGHFKYLTSLDLYNCNLTGPLPKSIGNLKHLTTLSLSSNKLNGTLPSSLFSLQPLEDLSVAENQFPQLTNLSYLDLSNNNFSGNLELDMLLLSLANLIELDLSYSGLSVTTSNSNHHVNPKLEVLSLASCKIKVFPESLRSMRTLQYLDLSSNKIHGQIPHWAGEIGGSMLYLLNLSNNFITSLPQFQWYGLSQLYLQSNLIQGPFPPSICYIRNLLFLDMSNNSFHGVIPKCLGNITSSLRMINLGTNRFQGSIPNVYENCGELEGIILNGNQLEGEIPSSLSRCKLLKVLDMGFNRLNGTFPSWLEDSPNLQALILKSNNFHGHIVPSSTVQYPFQNLQVLDLSHNRFVGELPEKYFQSFKAMKNVVRMNTEPEYLSIGDRYYYSILVEVKGQELLFLKLNVHYTIVDLSNNTFDREIPNIIGTLNSLKVLNLSHNNLNGQISHTLGNLSDIESLDLSWNRLTGEIPRTLADIKGLVVLNLSQNNLQGRIPKGNQFNTFEENSFGGNLGLCGFPLPKECEQRSSLQAECDEEDAEEDNIITWKAVMLGYGCGTLLGLVMGYLMLSTGKPKWFNAIADKGEHMLQIKRNRKRIVYIGK